MSAFRWPSWRRPLDALFLLSCVVLTAYVLVPEIWGSGKGKDYGLWYWAGRQVLHGGSLYERANGILDFIYPPTSAILLAIPSYFGKAPLYLVLTILNSVAWWLTSLLSNAMTGSEKIPGPWLAALPGFATVAFVFETYALGQPNLVLLAMMLMGFWWLQRGRSWPAGALFALATAIKVFPVAVFPYLLFRGHWRAATGMVIFLAVFLVALPAPIRGYQRNVSELTTWVDSMVGSASEKGFGQREEQNWSWINQSLIAQVHRFTRHIDYNQIEPAGPVGYVNVVNVDFKTANWIVLAVAALIGFGFMASVPTRSRMTPRSTADELGILFCLMTIASPLARQYYFVWLYFPLTVLCHRAAFDARPVVQRGTWAALAAACGLMVLSLPGFPLLFQALGNNLAATAVIVVALGWHMRHPPEASSFAGIRSRAAEPTVQTALIQPVQ
ncbi:MAG: glycosyltransferase family 87 protein [Afipia sp.]